MRQRYCYWSVCDGAYASLMEQCVASALKAGVFKEFHVLTDRPIDGCECYDAMEIEKTGGLFKLIYLKAGISKLLFDYFIWIDADSWFVRNPKDVLDCMGKSPIHVPLTTCLSTLAEDKSLSGLSTRQYAQLMTEAGVYNPVYVSGSAFWIVHRDAIDRVCELATRFRAFAKQKGFSVGVSAGLGYAMQMLCANPEAHQLGQRPDLWASGDLSHFRGEMPDGSPWRLEDPLTGEVREVNPCIIYLPHLEKSAVNARPWPAADVGSPAETLHQAEEEYAT